jgi:UDP-N-acetylglucosamine 4,6-dehydratase/5-epimerase
MFKNKIILVTGGTGSFGSTFIKSIILTKFKEIRVFSRDEKKQEDLRLKLKNPKVKFYIGDTRDYNSISDACKGVDYIFHAAALKQVPSCEFYPMEAIQTNILGTSNTINAAIRNSVTKLILLSTDKAVYPINAMGMSKALAEKVLIAKSKTLAKNETILNITRYGNVMNSRGSVIPHFIDQIKKKKELTITNPEMTRFVMSLKESVKLVTYALQNGKQGEIFIQKSPGATILQLANSIKKIFNAKNKIKIIGIRHGEKNHETLVSSEEMARTKDLKNYLKIVADNRDLNYSKFFSIGNKKFKNFVEYNSENTKRLNEKDLIKLLYKIGIDNV